MFMGFFTTGWQTSTDILDHKWMSSCTCLFLEWDCACWKHRNSHLYGPPKQQYQQKRQRLQAEVQVWLDAPKRESLVPLQNNNRIRKDITRATMETICTWLPHQQTLRRLIRDKQKANIISYFQSEASLEVLDWNFRRTIIAARWGIREQMDTTTSNEEPPN